MVICLEWDADLNVVQLMPLPLTVSCFSKIQIGFTFLVPAHQDSIRQRAIKWVRVYSVLGRKARVILWACLCVCLSVCLPAWLTACLTGNVFIYFIYLLVYICKQQYQGQIWHQQGHYFCDISGTFGCGLIIHWRRCDTLYTFGFVAGCLHIMDHIEACWCIAANSVLASSCTS